MSEVSCNSIYTFDISTPVIFISLAPVIIIGETVYFAFYIVMLLKESFSNVGYLLALALKQPWIFV